MHTPPSCESLSRIKTNDVDYRLAASVLIGDFFHNFGAGMFIGAIFISFSWATAWSITHKLHKRSQTSLFSLNTLP